MVIYADRLAISLTLEQREALLVECRRRGMGIGALLREAALEAIGRTDLSLLDEAEARDPGRHLDTDRPASAKPNRYGVSAFARMTPEQRDAIEDAAQRRGLAPGALMRDAALLAAGAPPSIGAEKPRRGRPVGSPSKPRKRGGRSDR